MKRFITLVFFLLTFGYSSRIYSADDNSAAHSGMFSEIADATNALTKWFTDLLATVGNLAQSEDKRRLIDSLKSLSGKLFDLEQEKRDLLREITRVGTDKSALEKAFQEANIQTIWEA